MMRFGATTSTNGRGRNVVQSIQKLLLGDIVEIAIGPRPIGDFMSWWQGSRPGRIEFRAHHAVPIGDGVTLRPEGADGLKRIADRLHSMGLRHYSMHPPDKRLLPTSAALFEWYAETRMSIFQPAGLMFSIETMYWNPHRPHNLVDLDEVQDFLNPAMRYFTHPLVLDLAHLRINVNAGRWPIKPEDTGLLSAESPWSEIHVSSNDGKRDLHRPFNSAIDTDIKTWLDRLPASIPRIAEGRTK